MRYRAYSWCLITCECVNKISSPSSRPQHACAHCHKPARSPCDGTDVRGGPTVATTAMRCRPARWLRSIGHGGRHQSCLQRPSNKPSRKSLQHSLAFLVKNEASAARWWDQKQKEARTFEAAKSTVVDSPFRRLAEEREEYYLENAFSSLITSVEVGLERFEDGATGTARLGSLLQQRYAAPRPVLRKNARSRSS